MRAYKGFDVDLKCRDFQYEIGKTYETEKASVCEEGFHACENPLDVFKYYAPGTSRFCEVELDGVVTSPTGKDKVAATKITIIREINIIEYNNIIAEYMKTNFVSTEHNSGDCSSASNSGDCSSASNSGYRSSASNSGGCSSASNSGYRSSASNSGNQSSASNSGEKSVSLTVGDYSRSEVLGKNSLAVAFGENSKAKGCLGAWITLTEWENGEIINAVIKKLMVK